MFFFPSFSTYIVKKLTVQDRDICRWGGMSSEEKLFFFFFHSFLFATPKSHPQKSAARPKTFVVSAKGRQGKLEREKRRPKARGRRRRTIERDHSSPLGMGTVKKYLATCLSFVPLSFSPSLSMSTSTRAFIHAKITKFRVKRVRKYVSTAVAETRWLRGSRAVYLINESRGPVPVDDRVQSENCQ